MRLPNNNFKNIREGTILYDKRYDEKVVVTNVSHDGEVRLTTNDDEWVDGTEYTVSKPLSPQRFNLA